jgi:hypothetical protein
MTRPRLASWLLAGAIVLLAVALIGQTADLLGDATVDGLSVAGLALLALGQGVRVTYDRRPRTLIILLLVLVLILFVLID